MGAAWLIITVTSAWFAAKKVNGGCRDRSDKEWHVDEFLGYEYRVVCWFGYIDLESAEKECGYGFGKLASIHSEYENEVVTSMFHEN
ncbi:hypothetical protein ANCCAN_09685 [Ancylostoma caninum]|uniref:C-type lectin domain-containing protein n=1 Tax=Ancylostoma caninum TaxID=29170 RepID=A0A368GIX6_ANCCA|nr:hypothetical protein ANCCAN_09685 [Ancylostoma caninum]